MTHDQNCPARDNDTLPDSLLAWEPSCQCELIAGVRADQRGQDTQVIDDIARQTHHHVVGSVEVCDQRRGDRCDITASLKAAAWALRRKP